MNINFKRSGFTLKSEARKGFTLIELIVTISIIAVAFGVMLSSYSAAQRGTRDAQRKSDLRTLQGALEQYKADQQYYPATMPAAGSALTGTGKTYLNKIPADPSTGSGYTYTASPSSCDNGTTICINYCLATTLESAPNPQPSYSVCPAPPSTKTFYVSAP